MSEKDEKIKSLVDMGFSEEGANMAITRCGMTLFETVALTVIFPRKVSYAIFFCLNFLGVDVDLWELVDSISAPQITEDSHSRNISDHQVPIDLLSFVRSSNLM